MQHGVISSTNFVKDFKNHERIMQQMAKTAPVFKGRTRFFVVKSNTKENLALSREHSVWATTYPATKRI